MEAKNLKKPARNVLGRGLSALISTIPVPVTPHRMAPEGQSPGEAKSINSSNSDHVEVGSISTQSLSDKIEVEHRGNSVTFVDVTKIINNPKQPRQEFNQEELLELAESIKTLGVLQPVLLRKAKSDQQGYYEIVAGERRWRASQKAELREVPAIVLELDDKQALEIALVENIQRSNLNPFEEAQAYERLAVEFSLSQKEIAERVGKDRASVANYLRLLKLPVEVQELLKTNKITMGHAKAIMTISEPTAQISLARKAIDEGLSVRALEAIAGRVVVLSGTKKKGRNTEEGRRLSKGGDLLHITDKLRESLGTKVVIKHQASGKGKIEIDYFSEQELERIVDHINK